MHFLNRPSYGKPIPLLSAAFRILLNYFVCIKDMEEIHVQNLNSKSTSRTMEAAFDR